MLKDFNYCVHTQFIFGKDAEKRVGTEIAKFGAKKVLIHHDSGKFLYDTGLLENVKKYLADAGIESVELGGVKPNPRLSLVREGVELCRREGVDFVLAIGGGSSIDSAKGIAAGTLYDGDPWDFYSKRPVEKSLPVGVILTYPATGSESGPNSVICNDDDDSHRIKRGMRTTDLTRPWLTFMNPELTYSLPPYLTSCGVCDMYAHVVERFFTPDPGYGIMDRLEVAIFKTLLEYGPKTLADPTSYENRAELMWIGTIAHNNTVGLGRVQDWSSHAMGHEIGGLYDTAHGATLTIIIPAWMKYVYKTNVERFCRYAIDVFGVEDGPDREAIALAGIEKTKEFFRSMNMPLSFKEAGIPTDQLEYMAGSATAANGTVGNFKKLAKEDVLAIYKLAAE